MRGDRFVPAVSAFLGKYDGKHMVWFFFLLVVLPQMRWDGTLGADLCYDDGRLGCYMCR